MKVFILCGGQGTRLREHTEVRPKPMVEIGGRPIVWHIMKTYSHYGFDDFVLCLGYKATVIKEYFLNYQAMTSDFTVSLGRRNSLDLHTAETKPTEHWRVTLADTGEETMTGGRIARASKYLDGDDLFLVTYGDGVADVDLSELVAFHRSHGGLATLTGVRPPSRVGELQTDGTAVTAFSEKPVAGQGLINGGYFCFHRDFLRYLSQDAGCVLEREPLEACAADGQLHVFDHKGFWQCMDTFRDWQLLETRWRENRAEWKVWADPEEEASAIPIGPQALRRIASAA